ncbi:MAG: ATP synthase subunit AtpR [Gammaproteobacteria bacterium]|jgi:F1F0 ATPase subunit 2|nr:ATP synthase subunit AtpR [Gammaproteobacteria bacterium]
MSDAMPALEGFALLTGFAVGLAVSALYFAGLAWTMRKALGSARPGVVLLASFLLRSALLLGVGFALARWLQPLSCWIGYMAAFFVARTVAVHRARVLPPSATEER